LTGLALVDTVLGSINNAEKALELFKAMVGIPGRRMPAPGIVGPICWETSCRVGPLRVIHSLKTVGRTVSVSGVGAPNFIPFNDFMNGSTD